MAGGRQERTGRPAGRAGLHPQDRNGGGGLRWSRSCGPARRA